MVVEPTAHCAAGLLIVCRALASLSDRDIEQAETRITSSHFIVDLEVEIKRLTIHENAIRRIEGICRQARSDASAFDAAALA